MGNRDWLSDITLKMVHLNLVKALFFQALLRFRLDAGELVLKRHLQTADHNARYTNKEIQNQMILFVETTFETRFYRKYNKQMVFFRDC